MRYSTTIKLETFTTPHIIEQEAGVGYLCIRNTGANALVVNNVLTLIQNETYTIDLQPYCEIQNDIKVSFDEAKDPIQYIVEKRFYKQIN